MAIENVNRPGLLTESAGNRPQQVKSSQTRDVSSVKAVDPRDMVLQGGAGQVKDAPQAAQGQFTDDVVNELNEAMLGVRRELKFSIDQDSGRAIVQVWDSETGDMIRQLPSDEVLAVSRHIREVLEASQSSPMSDAKADGAVGVIIQTTA
jgi:flagellar protein FlaG